MMEFLAGLGLGLCAGIVGTIAAIIYMRDQGYEITRTEKLTGREAEQIGTKLDGITESIKKQEERLDAINGIIEDQGQRINELATLQKADRERIEKLIDVVTMNDDTGSE